MALSWLVNGLLLALAAFVLIVGLRFVVAYINAPDDRSISPLSLAIDTTSRWTWGLIGGAFAVGGLGLVQLADIIGMVTMFVGSHPYFVSNGLVTGLGAGVAAGLVDLSAGQFVGIAVALLGLTMLVYEVTD
jgi:hypothetical protein